MEQNKLCRKIVFLKYILSLSNKLGLPNYSKFVS